MLAALAAPCPVVALAALAALAVAALAVAVLAVAAVNSMVAIGRPIATPFIMGRDSKLTSKCQEDICDALALMHTYEAAAAYAGIGNSTLSLWRSQGREAREKDGRGQELLPEERRKLKFLEAVEDAEAQGVFRMHQVVIKEAERDARLALQMLQIRRPNDYAPPMQRLEHVGENGGPVRHITTIEVHHNNSTGDG